MLGALLRAQHPPGPAHGSYSHPKSWEAAWGAAKWLLGLRGRASSQAGRDPQPMGRCSGWDHSRVRNCQPFGHHPPQPKGKAGAASHPPCPHQVDFSICQRESRAWPVGR